MASLRGMARRRRPPQPPCVVLLLFAVVGSAPVHGHGEACTRLSFDACEQDFQEDVMALFGHEESRRQEAWCDVLQDHEACLEAVLQSCRDDGYKELSARIGGALSDVVRKGCALPESWSAAGDGELHRSYALSDDDDADAPAAGGRERVRQPAAGGDLAVDGRRRAAAAEEEEAAAESADPRSPADEAPSVRGGGGARAVRSRAAARPPAAAEEAEHERRRGASEERRATATGVGAADDSADGSLSELLRQLRGLTRDMKHLYRKLPPHATRTLARAYGDERPAR